jgi:hypothetical protein
VINSLFGFLFGTVLSGSAVYSYLVGEYKTSNDLLTEDIYVRLISSLPRNDPTQVLTGLSRLSKPPSPASLTTSRTSRHDCRERSK